MKFLLPDEKNWVHRMTMPVRWGDMDAFEHVNNTVYLRYFESARIDWFYSFGKAPPSTLQRPVVVNVFCNFYKPLTFPADILINTFVSNIGRSSFDCWYTLHRLDEADVCYADGGATVVWTDTKLGQSAPLPDDLRAALQQAPIQQPT